MSKFVLKQYNNVNGRIKFFKIIENTICYWDNFCKEVEEDGTWTEQLISCVSRMNDLSNLQSLPVKRYRDITPKGETFKEFEIKTKDLRVYGIKDQAGNIIIFGGKKTSQPEDLKTFRSIKKRYLESIKK